MLGVFITRFFNNDYSSKVVFVVKTIFVSDSRGVFAHYYNGGTYNGPDVGLAKAIWNIIVRIGEYCCIPTRMNVG